jgi:ElaB/YqjD/DUF883 family membrane-anchored ribosome-binding protein
MAQSASSPNTRTSGDYGGRNTADDLADKAANLAEKTSEQIERVVQNVTDQGRQATENVQVVADNIKSAVDKSIKDQPLTTLAVAAGLGFVIGALWKS